MCGIVGFTGTRSAAPLLLEGLKRLETIVEQLEGGDLSLDQTVALYKEGMELSRNCAAQLKKVQQDVKKIVETSQDDFALALFPEEKE